MSRFAAIKAADHGLSETFARNLHLDENTAFEFFQAGPGKAQAQTACRVSQTGASNSKRTHQQNTRFQEAENYLPNGVDKTILPISPHSILLRPQVRPRMTLSSLFPRYGAIYQQRRKQNHCQDPKSGKQLRCHYAPWAPTTTTITSALCGQTQHWTTPLAPSPNTMSPSDMRITPPSGLGKRSRLDWSCMNDDGVSKAGGLDIILEEDIDKMEEGEREESGRFKRQRRW